jgi:hypothetical protein
MAHLHFTDYKKLVRAIQQRAPRLRGPGAGLTEACEFADMVQFDNVSKDAMLRDLDTAMADPTPTARGN